MTGDRRFRHYNQGVYVGQVENVFEEGIFRAPSNYFLVSITSNDFNLSTSLRKIPCIYWCVRVYSPCEYGR